MLMYTCQITSYKGLSQGRNGAPGPRRSRCCLGVLADRLEELRSEPNQGDSGITIGLVHHIDVSVVFEVVKADANDVVDPLVGLATESCHLDADEREHLAGLELVGLQFVCHHAAQDVPVEGSPRTELLAQGDDPRRGLLGLGFAVRAQELVSWERELVGGVRERAVVLAVRTATQDG